MSRLSVNLDEVKEIHQLIKGSRQVVLRDGTTLPISRSRVRKVESLLVPRLGR